MFKKILIANRGEIAVRIARTAEKMGIKTVAVYSDADKYARHVQVCDEAVYIGPSPSSESYLVVERIIDACKQTGADAVHPGYGFLSERAKFAQALADNDIAFIGPRAEVITLMGDKITANRAAKEAGVPTVPGHWDPIPDADHASEIAAGIGYPVMVKASAGGGGKGIRIAHDDTELREAFRLATSEALKAFGDDRVFIEKFIVNPRHIEIQLLGDKHGNVVYLGERECSIQRRHQKVIEEAPSPLVDAAMRAEMGERAAALARDCGYDSAGTVEFIADQDKNFYFLEMNTRLQVEHSVTEFITGLDLVEWMIRVAAGEPLDFAQKDVRLKGWAIESRIYAEDPNRRFMPSTGRLVRYQEPAQSPNLRVDSGIYEGAEISMFYDPMIAKVTVWERNREAAIAAMRTALDAFYIKGVSHNIAFLSAIFANPRFQKGHLSTAFIAEEYQDGYTPAPLDTCDTDVIVAAASLMHLHYLHRMSMVSGQLPRYSMAMPEDLEVFFDGRFHPVTVDARVAGPEEGMDITHGGRLLAIRSGWKVGDPVLCGTMNAAPISLKVEEIGLGYRLYHHGAEIDVMVYRSHVAQMLRRMPERKPPDMSRYLLSPMPGLLRSLTVEVGDRVEPGVELALVEAMKMENILRANRVGRIAKIAAQPGDTLKVGQIILEFE
ncbi:MAG: acetyl/propionyl/methylcrotonyl-CoA carboxylase subunit alpha [Hyphomicrobiales bacterium]|nr:acetyl/propionyl/methylcrotonyl-CoA carboxylase subunit alpha [Hyphomicrobiales bacterium]